MIDITVTETGKIVEIDMQTLKVENQGDMIKLITEILNKAYYSGESISLWQVDGSKKIRIEDW